MQKAMFKIDLLKGQGIPIKSGPEVLVIAAVTIAVPVIIALAIFGGLIRTKSVISTAKQKIVNYEEMTGNLSEALELQKALEEEKIHINNCIADIKSSIGRHAQRSPVLIALVENLPKSMILTKLDMKKKSTKIKVPKKGDPEKMIDINIPVSTLHISLSGHLGSNNDRAVRDFKDALRFSVVMKKAGLDDIKIAQNKDKYEIYCVFKPKAL